MLMYADTTLWRRLVARFPAAGLLAALLLPAVTAHAASSTATVPVSLDYSLLRYLLVQQLFNTADGSREILNDPAQCNRIVLADPSIASQGEDLEIFARVNAQLGLQVFGTCMDLVSWQGSVGFRGHPVIQPGARSVKVQPMETWLLTDAGSKLSSGWLWDAGNEKLMAFFGSFVLDLAPYIDSVGTILPDVLPRRSAEELQAIANSLRLGELAVSGQGLDATILFEVEPLPARVTLPVDELSDEEIRQLEARWQMMDALLVGAVKHYAAATHLQALRGKLLDILIDSRYRLRDALTEPASRNGDAVRDWFVESWHSLGPVVRSIAQEQPGQEQLLWFSVLSATDALYAINQLAATTGLEISTDGLRRLARMINAGQADELLRYSEDVDPTLQEMLREDIDVYAPEPSAWHIGFSLFPRAYAASPGPDINQWLPRREALAVYVPKIAALLATTSKNTLKAHKLEPNYQKLYEKLLLATAWQESCWRQYVERNKRIEPLLSSSGDVGLMQVNERVWRGFYDLQKLRWDINYNSNAGAEILFNYMVKYAIKRGEHRQPGGLNNIARASYSAYNGGPAQVTRYRRSDVAKAHREIDRLFWQKYLEVDAGRAQNVAACLGAELQDAAPADIG